MSTGFNLGRTGGGHKSPTNLVLDHELSELRLVLERQGGVLLDCPQDVLGMKVREYLELRRLNSVADLLGRLQASDTEGETLLEHLLDGETSFFRHPNAFLIFQNQVLPELHARKADQSPQSLRIWSAGCSTGEEAYSSRSLDLRSDERQSRAVGAFTFWRVTFVRKRSLLLSVGSIRRALWPICRGRSCKPTSRRLANTFWLNRACAI